MSAAIDPGRDYVERLGDAAPAAAKPLRRHGRLSRGGAAEALAAAGALMPAALQRHRRKRAGEPHAVFDVLTRYGRPAALADPHALIRERLADAETSPRLGGLLGDDGPRAATWLATRTGDNAELLGRALAAFAPLALGALAARAAPDALLTWLAARDEGILADPARLVTGTTWEAETFRLLRARAFPWWTRVLP